MAHSSIMRLNKSSMDKLYDLMTMGVKLHLVSARCPEEAVVHVLLNHLESVRAIVGSAPEVARLVTAVIDRVGTVYGAMGPGCLQAVRVTLLEFFKDRKVRVSLFLEDNLQSQDGMFVLKAGSGPLPFHMEVPGVIRYMEAGGNKVASAQWDFKPPFPTMQSTEPALVVFNPGAARLCQLGMNVYAKERKRSGVASSAAPSVPGGQHRGGGGDGHSPGYVPSEDRVKQAVGGVNLLASLVGAGKADDVINMNLFQDDEDPVSFDSPAQSAAVQAEREVPVTQVVFSSRGNTMPRNVEELKGLVKGWGDEDDSARGRGAVKRREDEEDLLDLLGD